MARQLFKAAGIPQGNVRSLARQVAWHEAGTHRPTDWAAAYAVAFNMPETVLFGGRGTDNDDVERRTFLTLATAATAASLARDIEPLRTAFESAAAVAVGRRDADTWERVAWEYAGEVGWAPAELLQRELATDFGELTRLIGEAAGTARLRLVHVAAQLAALTAITLTNLGEPRGARRWWRTAGRAADETGDHSTAALVRGRSAVFALYGAASPLSVLNMADEAIEVGQGTPCTGVVSGHAARAQALAELGRHREASEALDDVRNVYDRLPEFVRADRTTQWGWSDQRFWYVASTVHTHAGSLDDALNAQDKALAAYPTRNWQARTQVEMHRAGVLMRAGDVDEGARHMVRVLERLPAEQRADGLLQQSAMTSLRLAPTEQTQRRTIREARELLASNGR